MALLEFRQTAIQPRFDAEPFVSERLELAPWQRFHRVYLTWIDGLETRGDRLWAAFVVAMTAEMISVFLASTMTGYYSSRFTGLSADPFAIGKVPIPYPEHRLRLLGPLLAWGLGIKGGLGTFLPPLFNLPLLMVVYRVLRRRVSLELSVVATLLLATSQVTMTSRTILGYHDSMVFFFLLVSMATPSLPGSLLGFFLALLGDPRAVLCLPIMTVWTALESRLGWKTAGIRAAALSLLTLAFVIGSKAMLYHLNYKSESASRLSTYLDGRYLKVIDVYYLPLSMWMTFKSGWLLAFAPIWLWLGTRPWLSLVLLANLLAIFGAGILVHDVSRALAFAFPLVLLGTILVHRVSARFAVSMVTTCYLLNVFTPFYQGYTWKLWIQSAPLPWVVVRSWWNA